MAGWFRRIFSRPKAPVETIDWNAHYEASKHIGDGWADTWYDLYDADPNLAAELEHSPKERERPPRCEDWHLIFGLAQATPETQKKCFAVFPSGAEMYARFHAFRTEKAEAISEAEARQSLPQIAALMDQIGANAQVDYSQVTVIDRDTEDGYQALCKTDHITVLLEETNGEPLEGDALLRGVAFSFLTEPLYAAAGNDYVLRDHVTSAMFGGPLDELHTLLYRLWRGGWDVFIDGEDAIVLAHSPKRWRHQNSDR
jgi:hypothetical protein